MARNRDTEDDNPPVKVERYTQRRRSPEETIASALGGVEKTNRYIPDRGPVPEQPATAYRYEPDRGPVPERPATAYRYEPDRGPVPEQPATAYRYIPDRGPVPSYAKGGPVAPKSSKQSQANFAAGGTNKMFEYTDALPAKSGQTGAR